MRQTAQVILFQNHGDFVVRRGGLEPPRCYPLAPQASASANSATSAGGSKHATEELLLLRLGRRRSLDREGDRRARLGAIDLALDLDASRLPRRWRRTILPRDRDRLL